MKDQVIAMYCISSDIIHELKKDNLPSAGRKPKLDDAEVLTVCLVAALFFGGNLAKACGYMWSHGLVRVTHKSSFIRRVHSLVPEMEHLFHYFANHFKALNTSCIYLVDSYPLSSCQQERIGRAKLLSAKENVGFNASKGRYFRGVKITLITTGEGFPVDFHFTPGCCNDMKALKQMGVNLPEGSTLYGDRAYNDYAYEETCKKIHDVTLSPIRKKNSKRPDSYKIALEKRKIRKRIETTISQITGNALKKIHAVTDKGFMIKAFLFLLGFSLSKALDSISY